MRAATNTTALAGLVLLLLAASGAHACVYLMGESKDSVTAYAGGTNWTYGFRGADWEGVDATNKSWICKSGHKQSPIHLLHYDSAPKSNPNLKTTWSYTPLQSNGSNIKVFNNGHTIQIQWLGDLKSDVEIVSSGNNVTDVLYANPSARSMKKYQITPLQFHFHTTSEHAVDGVYYPMEMHIVHRIPKDLLPGCPDSGCLSVTGILIKISDDIDADNPALDAIWEVMPEHEGVVAYMKKGRVLDIEALMPGKKNRGYFQYEGSLTTPPCSEGLLWHVLKTPVTISVRQYDQYARAVGLKDCKEVAGTARRSLLADDHVHERLRSFQRGAYSGFVHAHELAPQITGEHSRKLLRKSTAHSHPTPANISWQCKVVSYGFTNRDLQHTEGRTVLYLD